MATKCTNCGSPASESLRHCPACSADIGPPNVRAAQEPDQREAINRRFDKAKRESQGRGCLSEFERFAGIVKSESFVVISVPVLYALSFIADRNQIYNGYSKLVNDDARIPASPENDSHRLVVEAAFFGSYGKHIRYGALALDKTGMPSYGDICFLLKEAAVRSRTTLFSRNSYKLYAEFKEKIPPGHHALWEERELLACAERGDRISSGQADSHLRGLLLIPGNTRGSDDFIEAIIFGGFTVFSIRDVFPVSGHKLSRSEKTQIDLVLSKFSKAKS